ncbi:hypothetical protein ACFYVL_02315 [Streptomyces sp. NPDC004111]|uniref:hypothetical protein n=1 Tax=Streptomyces sp. NPDC004111 TaxID=3364690 RepID=UPI00369176FD
MGRGPVPIAELARELRLWTVIASVHRLSGPNRPHNSLYVVSDRGAVVTRYDERLLSRTKVSYMYAPGVSQAQGHAAVNGYWVSLSVPPRHSTPSGIAAPDGHWAAQCPADGSTSVAVVNLDDGSEAAADAVAHGRPWRREARSGIYTEHRVTDPRSEDRTAAF